MDPKLLLLKHFEKLVLGAFVVWMLWVASGLLGSPEALEKAAGIKQSMTKVQTYVDTEASLPEPKGPGWKADLEQKLDPNAIPSAPQWATWLSHRRPGIVYYVEVIDKSFSAAHGAPIDVDGDTSEQGKIQLNWSPGPESKYVALSYEVMRSEDGKDAFKKIGETEETTFTDENISTRRSYVYKIVSIAILDKTDPIFADEENEVTLPKDQERMESIVVGPFATEREIQIIPVSTKFAIDDIDDPNFDPDVEETCNVTVRKLVNGKWEKKSFYKITIGKGIGAKKGKIDFTTGATLVDVLEDQAGEGVRAVRAIKIKWEDGQEEIVKSDDPELGTR